jgi:hypothetical protein
MEGPICLKMEQAWNGLCPVCATADNVQVTIRLVLQYLLKPDAKQGKVCRLKYLGLNPGRSDSSLRYPFISAVTAT